MVSNESILKEAEPKFMRAGPHHGLALSSASSAGHGQNCRSVLGSEYASSGDINEVQGIVCNPRDLVMIVVMSDCV